MVIVWCFVRDTHKVKTTISFDMFIWVSLELSFRKCYYGIFSAFSYVWSDLGFRHEFPDGHDPQLNASLCKADSACNLEFWRCRSYSVWSMLLSFSLQVLLQLRSLVGLLSPSTQEERYWFWPLLCLEFIDTIVGIPVLLSQNFTCRYECGGYRPWFLFF